MFKLITDSTCDMPPGLLAQICVEALPMTYTLEGREYCYTPDVCEQDRHVFYDKVRAGNPAVTAQVAPLVYEEAFKKCFEAGLDVIYIGFSSALSGTLGSGKTIGESLLEDYPDRRFAAVDSLCASAGEGYFVYGAAEYMRNSQPDFDAMVAWLEENRLRAIHWFTVDDLAHLKRGGRISGATAAIGTVLKIKPVMHVDNEGRLIAVDKVQGRKKSLRQLVDSLCCSIDREASKLVFVGHGDSLEDAELCKRDICERLNYKEDEVILTYIGPSVGAHSGPGTIALFFWGNDRMKMLK